jgi:predicted nicotinamide N-methyase
MHAIVLCAVAAMLPPPQLLTAGAARRSVLLVPVSDTLSVTIVEAGVAQQEQLVDAALDSTAPIGGKEDDPYGVVLWPAAQVVASALAGLEGIAGSSVLELGAGTGLCSITAMACGASRVLATDYRAEPLQLLEESVAMNEVPREALSTAIFDIKLASEPLPDAGAHYVVAADLLYQISTSVALARRCVEALKYKSCREVLVGDLGRPGRDAFLNELVVQGVRPEAAKFASVNGWLPGAPRHELVSTAGGDHTEPQVIQIGLLRLVPDHVSH